MKLLPLTLLTALLVVGCNKKSETQTAATPQTPPIELQVIAPAVTKQLKDRFGDRFVRVGKVQFDQPKGCYHVEVFYNDKDSEKRYVMDFIQFPDASRRILMFRGEFPLDLVEEGSPQGRAAFPVTIDQMMNK